MATGGYHMRSASSPVKPHPLVASLEETLDQLKASQSSPLSSKLRSLKGIYEAVYDLLQSQSTRQALFSNRQSQSVEQALGGSMRMLELCSKLRDFFSQMKEIMQQLGSSLRRRRTRRKYGEDQSAVVQDAVVAYLVSRKRLTTLVRKFIRCNFQSAAVVISSSREDESDSTAFFTILRGVEEASVEVFGSLFCFISQQGTTPSPSSSSGGWSFRLIILMALQSKCSHPECQDENNEMKKLDSEMIKLRGCKDVDFLQVQEEAIKGLEELESNLKEMEEELECIYKRQVKARVSLLNCFTR